VRSAWSVTSVSLSTATGPAAVEACDDCKRTELGRRRVRVRQPSGKRGRHERLRRILVEGGPRAYLGLALLVLGICLVPLLAVISVLTR
jgi:hypothetical protein